MMEVLSPEVADPAIARASQDHLLGPRENVLEKDRVDMHLDFWTIIIDFKGFLYPPQALFPSAEQRVFVEMKENLEVEFAQALGHDSDPLQGIFDPWGKDHGLPFDIKELIDIDELTGLEADRNDQPGFFILEVNP